MPSNIKVTAGQYPVLPTYSVSRNTNVVSFSLTNMVGTDAFYTGLVCSDKPAFLSPFRDISKATVLGARFQDFH